MIYGVLNVRFIILRNDIFLAIGYELIHTLCHMTFFFFLYRPSSHALPQVRTPDLRTTRSYECSHVRLII